MTIVRVVAASAAALLAWRWGWRRAVERLVASRLPVGSDGIIPGAEAISLPASRTGAAIVLLHGFGDTPQTVAYLASWLHARGYAVYAPLLPGHGRTPAAFRATGATQWIDAARRALDDVRARHASVGLVGLSMGGALATILAAASADLPALVLLAPYLEPPAAVRALARVSPLVSLLLPYLYGRNPRSIHDPVERARALSYGATTPGLVAELVRVARRARAALPGVCAPTLYVQSREDNRLSAAGAVRSFAALGARDKRLEWLEGCGHVITVDHDREQVARLVTEWMEERLRHPAAQAG